MPKLTMTKRDIIVSRALKHRFGDAQEALKAEEVRVGLKLYNAVLGNDTIKLMKKLPEGFFRANRYINIVVNGQYHHYRLGDILVSIPYDDDKYLRVTSSSNPDAFTMSTEFQNKKLALENEVKEAKTKLIALLNQCGTEHGLTVHWPDGKPFYSDLLGPTPVANLPAVQVQSVNKLFNLPVGAGTKDKVKK